MPTYYFNIADGEIILDAHGSELPNLAAARKEALKACREMVTGPPHFWEGKPWTIWVTDEPGGRGKTLLKIEVAATVMAAA